MKREPLRIEIKPNHSNALAMLIKGLRGVTGAVIFPLVILAGWVLFR